MTDAMRYLPELPEGERLAVLELYCTVCKGDIDGLAQALADGELHEVKRLAHRIRGSSSAIGEDDVARFAAWLEKYPDNDARHLSTEVLRRMRVAFRQVDAYVNQCARDDASGRASLEP